MKFLFRIKRQRGFTLMLAALVASISLALGSAIFSIAQKQLVLSSVGRDSEFAFYAADTAAECALYWDERYQYFSVSSAVGSPGAGWTAIANGDFNGDGKTDTLWQSTAGGLQIGFGGGTTSYVTYGHSPLTTGSQGLTVIAITDFSGDHKSDILWQYQDGSLAISIVDGTTLTYSGAPYLGGSPFYASLSAWTLIGINDKNGDGYNDLTWRQKSDGQTARWYMQGATILAAVTPTVDSGNPIVVQRPGNGPASVSPTCDSQAINVTGRPSSETYPYTMSFQVSLFKKDTLPNGYCANVSVTKSLNQVSNAVNTVIHADGFNVGCDTISTNKNALQRSVELSY